MIMEEKTLLCVDDEPGVLRALQRLLRKEDYRYLTAVGGEEALRRLEHRPVQVVLTDQRMPGMTGTALLQIVKHRYPDTVRVVLSGYAEAHTILDAINQGEIYRFIPKPWDDETLKVTLRQCFDHHAARQGPAPAGRVTSACSFFWRRLAEAGLDHLAHPFLGLDASGRVVLANRAARQALGDRPPLVGGALAARFSPEVVRAVIAVPPDAAGHTIAVHESRMHVRPVTSPGSDIPAGFALLIQNAPRHA